MTQRWELGAFRSLCAGGRLPTESCADRKHSTSIHWTEDFDSHRHARAGAGSARRVRAYVFSDLREVQDRRRAELRKGTSWHLLTIVAARFTISNNARLDWLELNSALVQGWSQANQHESEHRPG